MTARAGGAMVLRALVSLVLCALVGTALAAPAGAQLYFGQNLVQYDRLDWRVVETEHFRVHYYPAEREAAMDAARMAERSYARLSRLLQHQFREKKPIILFASRGDFAQSNVFGDLGEGTGGVTDPLRQRMAQPFTGDYKSFEHVLMHEMVHQFQFDIFSRGRAGANLQVLSQVNPPLWFMEGMAEFLSLGHRHPQTDAWLRDAALNGTLPTIRQMTERPYEFFPYRYGFALWQYVATRWGDDVVGAIMNSAPSLGVERSFKRETGLSLDELSDEWREAMQLRHLPRVAEYDRVRKFATPLLTQRRTGGFADLFIAPSLSPDGRYVAFISYGNFLRGEVFPELYLADARTGKRIKRLVQSGNNAKAEELRQLYSQSAFSPDGRLLAFTAQQKGRDKLFLLDVATRRTIRRFDLPLEGVLGPTWAPDGRRLAFTGNVGGITDLYLVDVDGRNLRQLTHDRYADMQPQWSPDGRTLVFASDRTTDFDVLRLGQWQVALYDLASGRVQVVPRQAGLNINPQWAPDGRSIAYVSDRTGIANVFLWDLDAGEHYQLTNVIGAVNSATEYSPALTWARGTDVLAFTYYEKGTNNVWQVRDPRSLKRAPFRERPPAPAVASVAAPPTPPGGTALRGAAGIAAYTVPAPHAADSARMGFMAVDPPRRDTTAERAAVRSWYRTPERQVRPSADASGARTLGLEPLSVTALLDSAALALPDAARFRDRPYRAGFQPEYIAQPQVGVGMASNYGQALYGGTTVVLADLLGNQQLAIAAAVNGTVQDAQIYVGYTNLARRLQYTTGASQLPIYFVGSGGSETRPDGSTVWTDDVVRFAYRDAFWRALYPLDRFTRFELGGRLTNVGRSLLPFTSTFDAGGALVGQQRGRARSLGSATMIAPSLAFVRDDALFGYTSPIMGSRLRLSVEPQVGTWRWVDYVLDYRRYDPVLFNFLTIATRFSAAVTAGRDEGQVPKYIGRPDLMRGYNRDPLAQGCGSPAATERLCAGQQLLGSRVAFANAEVRFPVVRRLDLGALPIALPPIDGLVFYDVGVAWTGQSRDGQPTQRLSAGRPDAYDLTQQRFPLRSYGYGVRFNLFGFMIVRWDYAWPLDGPNRRPFGTWFFGPSF
ncbi:MAG TPA: hypothetical protein VEZ47_02550 [Gemmatirosa sp.]|nr:hypothetical protein [Gemmatirosa sp.]